MTQHNGGLGFAIACLVRQAAALAVCGQSQNLPCPAPSLGMSSLNSAMGGNNTTGNCARRRHVMRAAMLFVHVVHNLPSARSFHVPHVARRPEIELEYKYVVRNHDTGEVVCWKPGTNYQIKVPVLNEVRTGVLASALLVGFSSRCAVLRSGVARRPSPRLNAMACTWKRGAAAT